MNFLEAAKTAIAQVSDDVARVITEKNKEFTLASHGIVQVSQRIILLADIESNRENILSYLKSIGSPSLYMINLSESTADLRCFTPESVQILRYSPSATPPLELLRETIYSVCNWMSANPGSMVALFCHSQLRRSVHFAACILAQQGCSAEEGISKATPPLILGYPSLVPTQARYANYMSIPPTPEDEGESAYVTGVMLHEAQSMDATGIPKLEVWTSEDQRFIRVASVDGSSVDGIVAFRLMTLVSDDVLLRVRLVRDGEYIPLFRVGFNLRHENVSAGHLQFFASELDTTEVNSNMFIHVFLERENELVDKSPTLRHGGSMVWSLEEEGTSMTLPIEIMETPLTDQPLPRSLIPSLIHLKDKASLSRPPPLIRIPRAELGAGMGGPWVDDPPDLEIASFKNRHKTE